MRKKYFNRALTTITALTLVSGMFPASALTASAENSGNYLDRVWDADNRQIIETLTSMPENAVRYEGQTELQNGKWYFIEGTNTYSSRMYINGSVSLILCDGAHISFDEGINIAEGSALTVYGGTEGTGELIASLSDKEYYAAIGGGKKENGGSLIIKGGKITVKSSSEAPAIGAGGGDYYHLKGNIDIYGGIVTAEAGKYGSGIGAGYYGNLDGSVNIYGGEVNATGGKYGSGIGGGDNGVGADVIVEGSSVILATGGMNTTSAIGHGNNKTECGTLRCRIHSG